MRRRLRLFDKIGFKKTSKTNPILKVMSKLGNAPLEITSFFIKGVI